MGETTKAHRLLVIEDEPTLAKLLTYNLSLEGYDTVLIDHGTGGLHAALHQSFDLIILDIMLPGMNGFEILAELRRAGNRTPVIILTARNAEDEVVQGLKYGADDYITKPFGVSELLARISAVLRRTQADKLGGSVPATADDEKVIAAGELRIYPDKYEVDLNGISIPLRPKEFEVLLHLVERPGMVVTRDQLMDAVWGYDYIGGQRTVDVHVSSLRKKLELNSQSVQIESIRGVGYKLRLHG